jgi:hypothetical protein
VRGSGRLTFTRGFGWYSFNSMMMERAPSQIHGSIVIKGIDRDLKKWHAVFIHLYKRRLEFHNLRDPLAVMGIFGDELDIVVEFDNDKKTFYFIKGLLLSVGAADDTLTLNIEKHIVEHYGLKSLELSR